MFDIGGGVQSHAERRRWPNGGNVVDLVSHRELIRTFGLSADEAELVDIDLALEYGLLSRVNNATNSGRQVDHDGYRTIIFSGNP